MAIQSYNFLFDCTNPVTLAQFWAEALGYVLEDDASDEGVRLLDPAGKLPPIDFIPVPEPKTVKNRLHLDLVPQESREAEIARLSALGATVQETFPNWTVMLDPEGNEFCIMAVKTI